MLPGVGLSETGAQRSLIVPPCPPAFAEGGRMATQGTAALGIPSENYPTGDCVDCRGCKEKMCLNRSVALLLPASSGMLALSSRFRPIRNVANESWLVNPVGLFMR